MCGTVGSSYRVGLIVGKKVVKVGVLVCVDMLLCVGVLVCKSVGSVGIVGVVVGNSTG